MCSKVLTVLVFITRTVSSMQSCDVKDNYIDISEGIHLPNGNINFNGESYTKNEYFVDENGLEKACMCAKKICIRKCCTFGYGYDPVKKECVKVAESFDPPVWDEYSKIRNANASSMFHFTFGKQNCTEPSEFRIRIGMTVPEHHLRKDGQLYIELPMNIPPWTVRGPDKYCIDTFVTTDENGDPQSKLDALVCFADEPFDLPSYVISSTCMLISCVFILATVAVYAWLPELRNLHGRVLMAYLLCLFVSFIFFATMKILLIVDDIGVNTCLVLTFIIYFFLLSSFFWLNVMSFDIWWTFSGKRGLSLEKLSINARFCAYALYAFSIPIVLTIILAALEFSGLPAHPLLPNIKHQGCFLYGKSKLLYLYGPMVVLCLANTIFFVLTAMKIAQIKQQTSVLKSKESTTHDQERNDQQRLLLYVKLFVVMGINWLLEVISALYPVTNGFWWITDAYNVLIGLIIFVIFVCKRKIFRLMKKRYRLLRGDPMSRTGTASSRTMSSRDDIRMSIRNNVNSNSTGQ